MTQLSSTKWLRLEGLSVLCLSVYFYSQFGSSWWLFGFLLFSFDLGMLGYLLNPKLGAVIYNGFHSYIGSAGLLMLGLLLNMPLVSSIGLIWFAHIGLDRSLGYGLKSPEGFGFTHLGELAKHA